VGCDWLILSTNRFLRSEFIGVFLRSENSLGLHIYKTDLMKVFFF
jgi:hypothetical protein